MKKKTKAAVKPKPKPKAKAKPAVTAKPKVKKEPAFSFVIEELMNSKIGNKITVKPMFGAHAIYRADEIIFILRCKQDNAAAYDNGMWVVASGGDVVGSLLDEFKALRPIKMFQDKLKKGKGAIATWLNLPEDAPTFESDASAFVDLAINFDNRLGRVPGTKKK